MDTRWLSKMENSKHLGLAKCSVLKHKEQHQLIKKALC